MRRRRLGALLLVAATAAVALVPSGAHAAAGKSAKPSEGGRGVCFVSLRQPLSRFALLATLSPKGRGKSASGDV